jgi:glyoxylase-like metal-dependent hydrolase (beta-lactamase superfamily II)
VSSVAALTIHVETVGPFQENTYLVVDPSAREAVLVDPGDEGDRLLDMVRRSGAALTAIWITHGHLDHVGAINAVRRVHDVPVFLHPLDRVVYDRAAESAAAYGLPFEQPDPPDRALAEGDRVTVGGLSFDVLHLPGHAPGHVAFVGHGAMLGGDVLFQGSIGRTDLPFCDGAAMERSLARVMTLDPALVVHPGHGPLTTIGAELVSNPFLNRTAMPVKR